MPRYIKHGVSTLWQICILTSKTEHCLLFPVVRAKPYSPLTLKELQKADASLPTCKAPGDEATLMEVYTRHGETLVPQLLKVSNASYDAHCLPPFVTSHCHFTPETW